MEIFSMEQLLSILGTNYHIPPVRKRIFKTAFGKRIYDMLVPWRVY